ncbi:MAG: hypothetical protein OJF49_001957 [Ktedonobacterales bacterium]|nr:MAG: hypothetical protein OJF49_001957 [Ktedonobacterales bacterium]
MTAAALLARPDDAWRYELVEGRLVRMPPAGPWHGDIASELNAALRPFVKARQLGRVYAAESGFVVSQPGEPDTVLAPDVAFVRTERIPAKDSPEHSGFWRLVPDLVAEVASPSQYHPELAEKARAWLEAGARLVWVVWPESEQVDVWLPGQDEPVETLRAGDNLDGRDVAPGFTYPVANLFE